jgi:adenylate cyclase
MAEKGKSSRLIYLYTFIFSVAWVVIAQFSFVFNRFDLSWDNFRHNVPRSLSFIFSGFSEADDEFLFGRYINKRAPDNITITSLDDHTLARYGWPVKRRFYGQLMDKLKELGVKSVGVDVMLFEPDRDNPSNDLAYVSSLKRNGRVVNVVGVNMDNWKVKKPIKGLLENSALIAYPNVDISMDADGYVRKYLPFYPGRDTDGDLNDDEFLTYEKAGLTEVACWKDCRHVPLPSLGAATYAVYSGTDLWPLIDTLPEEVVLTYRYPVRRKAHPAWDKDETLTQLSNYRHISARDIVEGKLSREEKDALKGGITLLGATALGAFDHVPNPFMTLFPGVEVHATFIDNLVAGDFRKHMDPLATSLLTLLLPFLPVLLRKIHLKGFVTFAVLGVLFILVMDFVLYANLVVMPFVSVMGAFFLPAAYLSIDKGLAEGREKRWIKNTFGQYLSPKVVDLITKDPSKLSLGGEKRDMTAFFLDLAGFTTMSEKLTPEELTNMLNEYLSAFTEIILRHDGTVDKYIGDCIVAFWNAPLDQADHRERGVLAAIDCQAEMTRLNETLTQFSIKPSCRVGVNSGPMVVGNMGSKTRLSYTVMGDSVNLASRMEGANKHFHSRIMTSEYTFEGIKDRFDYRYLGSIRVVGKAIPVKVYEPFARKGEAPADVKEMLGHYGAGIEKFYKGEYKASVKDFKAALAARPGDGPSEYYIETAEAYAKEPPKDWDQSFNLTSKG